MFGYCKALLICSLLILAACASAPGELPAFQQSGIILCENKLAAISADFPAARANACEITSSDSFAITIDPENKPINPSAWYAFKVFPKHAGELEVDLIYSDAKHRYPPKISRDGKNWELLDPSMVEKISDQKIQLKIKLQGFPIYVAAQEIFTAKAHNSWADKMAQLPFIEKTSIGQSVEGRPIYKLETRADENTIKDYVVFIGRQHPPEVTGALALIPFAETVLGNSDLAKVFRDKYNVIIIPVLNPDGVTHGNWRHNMGGIDLNRDWGPFTQPETRAVQQEFERFGSGGDQIKLFIDFHSTWRNLLYTQTDAEPTDPAFFTRDWLGAVKAQLNEKTYKFTREANKNSGTPVSKNYMYMTYGIPAITYEVGDHTDRKSIAFAADIFAQEMMKTMLAGEAGE